MKVNELLEKIKGVSNAQIISKMIEVKTYLPILEKHELAKIIVDKSTIDDDGYLRINEFSRYVYFITEVIHTYTNIEFSSDFEELSREYDLLVSNNLLTTIIDLIGKDYDAVLSFVDMEIDNIKEKQSVDYQFAKLLLNSNKVANTLIGKFEDFKVPELDISQENVDKIMKYVSLL